MPFFAFCRKCKHFMIGKMYWQISQELANHFIDNHGGRPLPDPRMLDFPSDFKPDVIQAEGYGSAFLGKPVRFMTRRFCSKEYCIAVTTDFDFDQAVGNDASPEIQEKRKTQFLEYLPSEIVSES